ncbi:Uncharacterized protein APZ42_006470 [Daphnia magna]|uniref:Uncharacterized protein n=1 Tax=Daphnia magna TaxID=35525 RepID=A0A164FVV7_9CRUS|nr:Uncharacterized protein APZ42_006470 [Daphnia magna]
MSSNVAQLTAFLKHKFYKTLALNNPEETLTKEKETKTDRCRMPGERSSKRPTRRGRFRGSSTFTQEEPFERCSKTVLPPTMVLYKLRRSISRGLTTD